MAKVKARVLVDVSIEGKKFAPNDVVELEEKAAKDHAEALDTTPAAVRYAESLKKSEDPALV